MRQQDGRGGNDSRISDRPWAAPAGQSRVEQAVLAGHSVWLLVDAVGVVAISADRAWLPVRETDEVHPHR